jgi:putative membrane protein
VSADTGLASSPWRLRAVSAALSIGALAAVFAAALGLVPARLLPRNDALIAAIPHLNALLSLLAIPTIVAGVRFARRGQYRRHRAAMLTSTALFTTFLACYLYRIAIVGPTAFDGAGLVATAYYGLLAVHIVLAVVTVPLVIHALLLAVTHPIAALTDTNHARIGRVAAILWVVSFAGGLAVYWLLHGP